MVRLPMLRHLARAPWVARVRTPLDRPLPATLVLPAAILLAALTWPVPSLQPMIGIDPSWQIALHLAAAQGLDFGRDLVFTYGPLGFLTQPLLVDPTTATLSFAFVALTHLTLTTAVLAGARRAYPLPIALVFAFAAMSLPLFRSDVVLFVVAFACVLVLEDPGTPHFGRLSRWLVPLGGFIAAFELLAKINSGLVTLAFVALTAWFVAPRRWASELLLGVSFAVSFAGLWLATGNDLHDIPTWLRRSYQLTAGFTEGLPWEQPGREWEYFAAALVLVALAWLVWRQSAPYSRGPRAALLTATAVFAFAYFKYGFVRHDVHAVFFFSAIALLLPAFAWRGRLRIGAIALFVSATFVILASAEFTFGSLFRPRTALVAAADEIQLLASPSERNRQISDSRRAARTLLALDSETLELLRGHSVHVYPYETSAVWAYGLRWRPLPIFQTYTTYTAGLDALNAGTLGGRDAPERILRQNVALRIDYVAPEFDSPAVFLAMLCNYEERRASPLWQVLARTADRCGKRRFLSSVKAAPLQTVAVPAPPRRNELVIARFYLSRDRNDALQTLLYKKTAIATIVLDEVRRYRLIEATAANDHVMRVPPGLGYSVGYGRELDTKRFRLENIMRPYRVDFYAVPAER